MPGPIEALGKSYTPLPTFEKIGVVYQGKSYEILTWKKAYTKCERAILALKVIVAVIFTLGLALCCCPSLKRDWKKATQGSIEKSVCREKPSVSPFNYVRNHRPLEVNEGIVLAAMFLRHYQSNVQLQRESNDYIQACLKNPMFLAYPEEIMQIWDKKYGGPTPHPGPTTAEGVAWRFFKNHYFTSNS